MASPLPIGVFDSGLGGLSVLRELRRVLPAEDFLYLGDVARLPYGTKSESVVTRYASTCVDFLQHRHVKLTVIACNTATAMALPHLERTGAGAVCGVIEPGVRAAVAASKHGKVLVLGTEATVKSAAYLQEFRRQAPDFSVEQLPCPLLVPLAEEGWFSHDVTKTVIRTYLERVKDPTFDAVLLGCTHYPLLVPSFREVLGDKIAIVDSAHAVGTALLQELDRRALRHPEADRVGTLKFYATDTIPKSLPILHALFGNSPLFEEVDL